MEDREMLMLAAKAAGYKWREDIAEYRNERDILGLWIEDVSTSWNPLKNAGDRYRLLSKLKAIVDFDRQVVMIGDACIHWPKDEPDEARAIVRAAAEIGKRMGEFAAPHPEG